MKGLPTPRDRVPTVSLRRFFQPAAHACDLRPLARLHPDGRLEPLAAVFLPSQGPCRLVLWRPGPEEPAFSLVEGEVSRDARGWAFTPHEGSPQDRLVMLWVPTDAAAGRAGGHRHKA